MPAECEVNDCGILAVGRCTDCGSAGCASHLESNLFGASYGRCSVCIHRKSEVERARGASVREPKELVWKLVGALVRAGRPGVECYVQGARPGRLLGVRSVHDPAGDIFGWPVGTFEWEFAKSPGYKNEEPSWMFAIQERRPTYVNVDGSLGCAHEAGVHARLPLSEFKWRGVDDEHYVASCALFWETVAQRMKEVAKRHGVSIPA